MKNNKLKKLLPVIFKFHFIIALLDRPFLRRKQAKFS